MTNKSQMMKVRTGFGVASLSTLLLASFLAPSVQAADTWDGGGGDDNWSTTNNWDTDTLPGFPAALTFGGTTRLTPDNDLTGLTVNGITFAAEAGAFTLLGNPITLEGDVSVVAGESVKNNQTINLPITLATNSVLSAGLGPYPASGNNGVLVINGEISGPYGLTTPYSSKLEYVQLNGANTYSGDTLITGDNRSFSIGNANAFGSGKLFVGATPGDSQMWIQSAGSLTVTNDVDIQTSRFILVSRTVAGKAAGNLTLSGNVLLNQSGNSDFYCQKTLTLSGTVSGGNAKGLRLAAGTIILQGINTFTNNLSTSSGGTPPTLNINSDGALGHTNNVVYADVNSLNVQTAAGTSITLAPSRSFNSKSGKTITFDIPSTSTLTVPGLIYGNAIAKTGSGTLTLTGVNTYSDGTTLNGGILNVSTNAALGADTGALNFTGAGTLQPGVTPFTLPDSRSVNLTNAGTYTAAFDVPTNFTMTVAGVIKGNAATNSSLSKTGPGALILTGGTDGTSLGALGTLEGRLTITNGEWDINTASLNGESSPFWVAGGATFEQTGGTLSLSKYPYMGVRSSSDPTKNLTSIINISGGTMIQGNSSGQLLVGRRNSAVLTISGDAFLDISGGMPLGEYAGFTTVCNIDGGVVALRYINSRATDGLESLTTVLNLNGGTLRAIANHTPFIGGAGVWLNDYLTAAYVKSGGAIIDSQAYAISINQILEHDPDLGTDPDGGLIKRGTGSLTLSTNATYTGVTSIEAGTLKLDVNNTLPSANTVIVSDGALFNVNGKTQALAGIGGGGTMTSLAALTVTGTVAPGDAGTYGTLTLADAPAALSGTLAVNITSNACDCLHVSDDLDLTTLSLNVEIDTAQLDKSRAYTVASCTGTLGIPFASTGSLPTRWTVKYDTLNQTASLRYNFGTLIMMR